MRLVTAPYGSFWVYDQDHLGQIIETGAFWDGQLLPFIDEVLATAPPGSWAIDLGANVGVFTVYLAKQYRVSRVIAVEANPGTFDLLCRNLDLNGVVDRVTVIQAAAYDQTLDMDLAPAEWLGWPVPGDLNTTPNASSIAYVPTKDGPVSAICLDPLIPVTAHVAVIKCDVQGCDLPALRGLLHTIARCRPLILFEFEGAMAGVHGDTWEHYERFFAALYYTVTRVREDIWDFAARPD